MEQTEFNKKISILIEQHISELKKECNRLYNSGGIDTHNASDDFMLPKTIMHVALINQANDYKPLSKEALKSAKNLMKF